MKRGAEGAVMAERLPSNCWLDDEDGLCPSPCVFDDPNETIENCAYAQLLSETGGQKTDCKYYRKPTAEQQRKPLWQVMQAASASGSIMGTSRQGLAAVIRAIANELADRQSEWRAGCVDTTPVEWLLTEATLAERGNTND